MNSSELESALGEVHVDLDPAAATAPPVAGQPRAELQMWGIALALGLAGGLLAWGAGELTYGWFQPQRSQTRVFGVPSLQTSRQSQNAANLKNAALAFTLLGCTTGLAMGFGGGVAGRTSSRGAVVGVSAMLMGGLVGAGASAALLPLFFRGLVPDLSDLLTPILIHSVIWGAIGAIGGLAFAIGTSRARHVPDAIIGACLGAVLATVIFHCAREMFFPGSRSSEPLGASPIVRLLAMMLVSIFQALGAVWGTTQGLARHPSSDTPLTDRVVVSN